VCLLEGASDRLDFLLAGLGIRSSALQSGDAQTVVVPCNRDTLPAIQEQAPVLALWIKSATGMLQLDGATHLANFMLNDEASSQTGSDRNFLTDTHEG
jgi:hypothetical protein